MLKRVLSVILLLFTSSLLYPANHTEEAAAPGTIKGLVYDSLSLQPMEYATVSLFKADNDSLVTGVITDINGYFRLRGIEPGSYFLRISFIGYQEKQTEEFRIENRRGSFDAGRILLSSSSENLEEVTVVAERPTMSYQIDKKVINVSQQHTSASGTAVEVLENIPSVTVSIEGDVSLRGSSNFTVLIDGKPTILESSDILNQIPASQIESIEIITNPSARYDPDGVTGIINIVMKRQRLQGINGVVNANAGSQGRYGGDFLLNYREGRFNVYAGADYNKRRMTGESITQSQTLLQDTFFLYSSGDFLRNRDSWGIRTGVDFNINPSNTLSLAYRYGERESGSESDRIYQEWTSTLPSRETYASFEEGSRGGHSQTFTLDYLREFDQEGHNILAQLILASSRSEDISLNQLFNNDFENASGGQRSIEEGPSQRYTFRLDYTLPIGGDNKLEAGYQSRIRSSEESYSFFLYNPETDDFQFEEQFSRDVEYSNNIHSLYSTFSGQENKFGYQLGLRGEYTDRLVNLSGQGQQFPLNRWDYYPTLHLSYNFTDKQQLMTSYTRRLQRLRGWYLEPFYTWEDAYNVRTGNPSLDPEYIDSYELSFQNRFNENVLSIDVYYRITNNKIESVRSIYDDQENIFLTTFANVGKDYSLGTELMTGFDPFRWWHIDIMGNLYDFRQEGTFNGREYSASSFNWNLRINNDFSITRSTRVQLRGMYNSPTVTAQGERSGFFVTNLAIRQDFLERALSVTLQIRDALGTVGRERTVSDDDFFTFSRWEPNTPIISLNVSYRINNYRSGRRLPENSGEIRENEEDF